MSVLKANTRWYGSANMPDADGTTVGGAVSFSKKIVFDDITPTGLLDYVSSSASDTAAVITAYGRDSTGVIQSEAKTLTGTTLVNGTQSFERLMKALASGTTAVGDIAAISHTAVVTGTAQAGGNSSGITDASITLQSGQGASVATGQIIRITNNSPGGAQFQLRQIIALSGDIAYVNRDWGTAPSSASTYTVHHGMLFDLSPNQITEVRRPFYNVAADISTGSTKTFYEKVFAVNDNTVTALTVAVISKQADPSAGTFEFAVCTALNDTQTATNRQTLPTNSGGGALTFTTGSSPQSQNVPAPQNLPSGNAPNAAGAEGVWLSLALPAGQAPAKTTATMRIAGQTT